MITPYLKGLFNKKVFSTIIPLCILFIGFIFIKNFENITKYTFQGKDFWLFFLFAFISVTFHEFGHVTATEFFWCKTKWNRRRVLYYNTCLFCGRFRYLEIKNKSILS